jgi:hypothetical protein
MNENLQKIAASFKEAFRTKKRENGELFYYIENKEDNEVLRDFISDSVHQDFFPDDFKYKTVYYFLEAVEEGNTEFEEAFEYVEPDHNNHDLLSWASSNLNRMHYVNEVLEEGMIDDFGRLLRAGQYREIEEICTLTYQFLEDQAELSAEFMEEEEYE